uniref:Uncharacterized protein n=1 Tax=Phocoena sinus TaxID=42100 RepID=A0A8C9EFX6_PHOSS
MMRLVVTLCPLTIWVDDVTDLKPKLPEPEPAKDADEKVARLALPPLRPRVFKAEKASTKAGNSPKPAERAPRSPWPRPACSLPSRLSQKSKEKGSRPPKNSRKMSLGLRNV